MTSQLSPLRLSIVDFLGVFLPGAVWALLMITTLEVLGWTELSSDSTPFSTVRRLLGVSEVPTALEYGLPFYVGLALFALLLGYLVEAFSARPAEWIAFCLKRVFSAEFRLACRTNKAEFRFPYNAIYRDEPYFISLSKIVKRRLGHEYAQLPGYEPFESCKRLLRVYAPALWEEAQQREAQIRFLVSLSLASLYSTIISIGALMAAVVKGRGAAEALAWFVVSALVSVFLSLTLWTRRHREVEDIYLSTLIADKLPASPLDAEERREDDGADDE